MISVRIEGSTLEVTLPPTLLVTNRVVLIEAVAAALTPGIRRVRLDAASLREIDCAGFGALARILRMTTDTTSTAPELVNADPAIIESMRAVLLLEHFNVVTTYGVRRNLLPWRRPLLGRGSGRGPKRTRWTW
jgi:hypothetical protein